MQKINRIYHKWSEWECYPAGFYENKHSELSKADCEEEYRRLLSSEKDFSNALKRVITEWKNSCEHYLTNEKMNRIVWLGQASLCISKGIPSAYRGGYFLLSDIEQANADNLALTYLNKWLTDNAHKPVSLISAGVKSHANIY